MDQNAMASPEKGGLIRSRSLVISLLNLVRRGYLTTSISTLGGDAREWFSRVCHSWHHFKPSRSGIWLGIYLWSDLIRATEHHHSFHCVWTRHIRSNLMWSPPSEGWRDPRARVESHPCLLSEISSRKKSASISWGDHIELTVSAPVIALVWCKLSFLLAIPSHSVMTRSIRAEGEGSRRLLPDPLWISRGSCPFVNAIQVTHCLALTWHHHLLYFGSSFWSLWQQWCLKINEEESHDEFQRDGRRGDGESEV